VDDVRIEEIVHVAVLQWSVGGWLRVHHGVG
jgi:hypothetical protein